MAGGASPAAGGALFDAGGLPFATWGAPLVVKLSPPAVRGAPRTAKLSPRAASDAPPAIKLSPPAAGGAPLLIKNSPPTIGGAPPEATFSTLLKRDKAFVAKIPPIGVEKSFLPVALCRNPVTFPAWTNLQPFNARFVASRSMCRWIPTSRSKLSRRIARSVAGRSRCARNARPVKSSAWMSRRIEARHSRSFAEPICSCMRFTMNRARVMA